MIPRSLPDPCQQGMPAAAAICARSGILTGPLPRLKQSTHPASSALSMDAPSPRCMAIGASTSSWMRT